MLSIPQDHENDSGKRGLRFKFFPGRDDGRV
jgi:hypothetical protein